eukprot:g6763.t1
MTSSVNEIATINLVEENATKGNSFKFSQSDFTFALNEQQFCHLLQIIIYFYKESKSTLELLHKIYLLDCSEEWKVGYKNESDLKWKLREMLRYFCKHAKGVKDVRSIPSAAASLSFSEGAIYYYWGYAFHVTCFPHGKRKHDGRQINPKVKNISNEFLTSMQESDDMRKNEWTNKFSNAKGEKVLDFEPKILTFSLQQLLLQLGTFIFQNIKNIHDVLASDEVLEVGADVVEQLVTLILKLSHNEKEDKVKIIVQQMIISFANIRKKQIMMASPSIHSLDPTFRATLAAFALKEVKNEI